jgi:multidrug efflux pump subunit AcrA (membrane-fusion protein)
VREVRTHIFIEGAKTMNSNSKSKFEKDSPETYQQAKDLLKEYYKKQRATGDRLPDVPMLQSWILHEDGVMVIVDGASGRKLDFETDPGAKDKEQAQEQFELAQLAELDAEAKAYNAQVAAEQAEAEAQRAKAAADKAAKAAKQEAKAKAEKK